MAAHETQYSIDGFVDQKLEGGVGFSNGLLELKFFLKLLNK
jgi:hypothetical protein